MMESALFYWVVCDMCGEREPHEDDGTVAWASKDQAVTSAIECGWDFGYDERLHPIRAWCDRCAARADF